MKVEIKRRIDQINNGEIPDGYKKTEFGIFPCDWETDKTFGDLFDFYGGLGKSRDELSDEGYPYLHYGDLHKGSFNKVSYKQYEQLPKCDIVLTGKETCLMEDGDVAFLDASEDLEGTSRAVLIDNPDNKPFIAGLHIIYGKSKDDSLEKWYKQYITSTESTKKQFQKLASGFKVYGLNRDTLSKIHVAYPTTMQEQSRIAEILMKWDKAIELWEELILALSLKQKVIIKKVFSNISEWECISLDKVVIKEKGCIAKVVKNGTNPVIDMEYLLSKSFVNYSNDNGVVSKKEDILILWDGAGAGRVITDVEGVVGSTFSKLSLVTDKIDYKYMAYWLQKENNRNFRKREGSGIPHMPKDYLHYQKVYYPLLNTQRQISSLLGCIEAIIEKQKHYVAFLKRQRKMLQQYLLNGIVRVH